MSEPADQTPLAILRRARARIATPERWTRGVIALTLRGFTADASDPDAAQWCAIGAIVAESDVGDSADARGVLRSALRITSISDWNDSHTHEEVIAGFDKAIASLETST